MWQSVKYVWSQVLFLFFCSSLVKSVPTWLRPIGLSFCSSSVISVNHAVLVLNYELKKIWFLIKECHVTIHPDIVHHAQSLIIVILYSLRTLLSTTRCVQSFCCSACVSFLEQRQRLLSLSRFFYFCFFV